MPTTAPLRAQQSYRHEAYLWHRREDFVSGLAPFVLEGLEAGEAVMVAVTPEHIEWLRDELGAAAAEVCFVDMVELGRNPARIIPAWQEFLDRSCAHGRPARGIGEPLWPGRGLEEVRECQLHEALLNLAVDPQLPFWLLCPYDAERLDPAVLAEVGRSHPAMATATSYAGSGRYGGHEHAGALFSDLLLPRSRPVATIPVTRRTVAPALQALTWQAVSSDLLSDRVLVLVEAVRGLAADGLRRGADRVRLRVWDEPDELVCEVADRTVISDFLVGRRRPADGERDAFWLSNQVCDLVELRSGRAGTQVRLHLRKASGALSVPGPALAG